jgi:TolA-binding protein
VKKLALSLTVTLLMWAACGPQARAAAAQQKPETAPPSQSDKEARQKVQYQKRVEAKLHELDRQIARLEEKSARQTREARSRYAPQLKELKEKRDQARQDLEKLRKSSVEAWRAAKPDLDEAMKNLESAYRKAVSKFKS